MIQIKKLPSGLTCYVIPKKGYVEKQAAISVNYGSADMFYAVNGGGNIETPQGVAHFLEHKLFEAEDMNVYDEFTKRGAYINAFTNFTNTAYYFTAGEQFEDCLRLLLKCVQSPFFTDENVEKEKGIITQEINMYRDDPQWKLYINLHQALFHQHPVRYDIAGTAEAINGFGKDLLYQCYETFYTPSNMALICAGELEAERIFELAEREISAQAENQVARFYGDEPLPVLSAYTEEVMPVSIPMFEIGYKALYNPGDGHEIGKLTAAAGLLTDITAGESSPLYAALYGEGLIDNHFSVAYIGGTFFGTSLFTGYGTQPRLVEERLVNEINRLKKEGISHERFEIIKNKHIGRYIRSLNNLDHIVTTQIDLHAKSLHIFSMLDILKQLTINDVESYLYAYFIDDRRSLSVVWPEGRFA